MKVLSADDSAIIRRIIRGVVEAIGYELVEAPDGQAAWEMLEKHGNDIKLILLDWNMPRMDGYTLLTKIKSDVRFKDIPVAMVTTESERKNAIKAIQAGANNYITKPFTQEDLSTKIMECLGMGF
jgi:two-component system chemotaxis response regulator CheY